MVMPPRWDWIFCSCFLVSTSTVCQIVAPDVGCSPRLDYVETDPELHRFFPFVTELHRCRGANSDPSLMSCVPIETSNQLVNMRLVSLASGDSAAMQFVNHTSCTEVCLRSAKDCNEYQVYDSASCECVCLANVNAKISCPAPFEWSSKNCNCSCPLQVRKQVCASNKTVFSERYCGCVCSEEYFRKCADSRLVLDRSTCACRPQTRAETAAATSGCSGGVSGGVLAVVIIFEAVCFIGGYFLLYVYCYKKRYVPMKQEQALHKPPSGAYDLPNGSQLRIFDADARGAVEPRVDIVEEVEKYSRRVKNPTQDYYPAEEKSPLTAKNNANEDWYLYNDVIVADGPPHTSEPGDTTLSDEYASVTVV